MYVPAAEASEQLGFGFRVEEFRESLIMRLELPNQLNISTNSSGCRAPNSTQDDVALPPPLSALARGRAQPSLLYSLTTWVSNLKVWEVRAAPRPRSADFKAPRRRESPHPRSLESMEGFCPQASQGHKDGMSKPPIAKAQRHPDMMSKPQTQTPNPKPQTPNPKP